jgi:hypothetical protein
MQSESKFPEGLEKQSLYLVAEVCVGLVEQDCRG